MKKRHLAGDVQRAWVTGSYPWPARKPKGPCNIRKELRFVRTERTMAGPRKVFRQVLVDHSRYPTRPEGRR